MGSDIDLAIEGVGLHLNDLIDLRCQLENLMLPYRFDLVEVNSTTEASFRDPIERIGKTLFERGKE